MPPMSSGAKLCGHTQMIVFVIGEVATGYCLLHWRGVAVLLDEYGTEISYSPQVLEWIFRVN
jgi:hypothetical protein